MIPVYNSARDLALKLFREAGRTWKSTEELEMADHLFNFAVTNSSLRDWYMAEKGITGSAAGPFHISWRARAGGLFGDCADIANASKHFVVKPCSVDAVSEKLVALGPQGIVPGLKMERPSFKVVLSSGVETDLLKFLHYICVEWENIFQQDPALADLPSHGVYMMFDHKV